MNNSTYTTATTVLSLFPFPESRILVYEKDGNTLKPIKIYYDDSGKKWVEARPDTKFVIEIKNNSGVNALAIVSVDGLNVIDGKRAELKNENGYVIDRYSSTKISGWRTGMDEVREFVFTADKSESFSHKLGADESNTGVIGIAMFKEKTPYWTYTPSYQPWYIPSQPWYVPYQPVWTISGGSTNGIYNTRCGDNINHPELYSASTNCCTTGDVTQNNVTSYTSSSLAGVTLTSSVVANGILNEDESLSMSTAQGDAIEDSVHESNSLFDQNVSWTDVIYYDSYDNLVKNGIIKKSKGLPRPFGGDGFCPSL